MAAQAEAHALAATEERRAELQEIIHQDFVTRQEKLEEKLV